MRKLPNTAAWISSIKHSDAFQDYYQHLQRTHSEALLAGVRERMLGTADLAVEELQRRISAAPDAVPYNQLLETVDVLTKRAVPEQRTAINVDLRGAVTRQELSDLRDRMRGGGAAPASAHDRGAVDAEIVEEGK
jgi:hypothetical protein